METTFGCGLVALIPAIILAGVLLVFEYSISLVIGSCMILIGLFMCFGLGIDLYRAVTGR